uniref:Translocation and assembly module TamB C-terminal domain-containing protein n=1 Tax=Glycine max TaxID=3847 RepID=A0A0R0KB57_SOYBN
MDTLFFGIKLRAPLEVNNTIKRVFPRSKRCNVSAKHVRYPSRHAFRFCSQNVNLLRKPHVSASGSRLKCFKEKEPPFSLSVSYFTSLWKEGVLLMRASVFTVVISGLCLLVWFGRNKAKGFVETNILPSVCSVISEYVQRDVCFGKVVRISPLSVTLESCSFGPGEEEFSCGEAPTAKVRFRPLASLWRGKFVFDAVLSHPCVLVVQKKDYSWLGIPLSQGGIQRRLSTNEGLDHRTKVRRVAREEAAAKHVRDRDDAAREAAEMGYFVSEKNCGPSKGDDNLKEIATHSVGGTNSKGFFCMKKVEQHGHRCVDTGVDYDMKHADLEESFRVKFPEKGLKFWKRVIKGHRKHKFKQKAKRSDISASGIALRKRILERGAFAANAYFHSQSHGMFEHPLSSSGCFHSRDHDRQWVKSDFDKNAVSVASGDDNRNDDNRNGTQFRDLGVWSPSANENINGNSKDLNFFGDLSSQTRESKHENLQSSEDVAEHANANISTEKKEELRLHVAHNPIDVSATRGQRDLVSVKPRSVLATYFQLKSEMSLKVEGTVAENVDGVDVLQSEDLTKILPVTLDSVQFRGATVMLLTYGDREVRVMENANGHVKFHNHYYNRINVKLGGNCKTWRSDDICEGDGWLSVIVFVDTVEQKWHANLKIDHFFVPLFERILDIPITWSKGMASGQVHLCMSKGETFPNHHGQLDVTGLNFQILNAPSCFSDISGSLCFRGQSIFLHNACGWFGSIPLEASGDFGIHPEEGEFHLMCQVPSVEVNALMRTFNMRSLLFPLAGSITALFNCQGPLDTPIFVGTGTVSRTFSSLHVDTPTTVASEALAKSKEAGALAAFDRVPFSHVSANFTFNTDSCIADLYGIRASLVDGGEIRGAGTVWICSEAVNDETAIDANFSGSLAFEKIMLRYIPSYHHLVPLKFGVLSENTKLSGSLLRPRFDIKWTAPTAEGPFSDARGDIIISHDFITVNSASAALDLYMKVQTSFSDNFSSKREEFYAPRASLFTVGGVEFDLHMRGFEFFSLVTPYTLDFPRALILKATGRIKFQGKVLRPSTTIIEHNFDKNKQHVQMLEKGSAASLVGEVSISGLKLNQLMLAPQMSGSLSVSPDCIKLNASGRPDESLVMDFVGPLQLSGESGLKSGQLMSISLHKGQLRANVDFQPCHSASLEVWHFPLDELELASLKGTIQRAEIQLNLQKRRGHGIISVLQPKFNGVLGEALDVAARWSGDVITIEKTILEQSYSYYEMQGEYVLPGTRDDNPVDIKGDGFLKRFLSGHLGSVISSMGRWRMKLEVPRAEVAEMLPLARLLSRSMDPAVLSRSKDFFIQSLQSIGLYSMSTQQLIELIREHHVPSNDVLEDLSLPGLLELKGRWHGSLNASGGGNGDTLAEFDFHGEDWEWGEYKTQCVLAVGTYSNVDGLHLEKILIQKDNATIHADGTLLGPKSNLHFAVLNFPVSLIPTVVQIIDSTASNAVHSLWQLLAPIRGILHMEGDLRGSLAKPECDAQIRLLDGAIGGIVLERAEVVASLTSTNRFLFNAKFEPLIQNGHVLIQGAIPVTFFQSNMSQQDVELDKNRATWAPEWVKKKNMGATDDARDKKVSRRRNEEGWNTQLAESLKGLNWQILDVREVRVDVDIKDGGMMLVTALTPYANWLYGSADIMLEVRGTVDQPVLNGYASLCRASISSPVFRNSLTNFGGTVHMKSNRLSIPSLESRIGRKGKLLVKGNLPLRTKEAALNDKIEFKCEVLEVQAKNILSGQVNSQVQITGSILQPNISGNIKLSQGEVYLPHDKGGAASNGFPSYPSALPRGSVDKSFASRYISRYFGSEAASPMAKNSQSSDCVNESIQVEKDMEEVQIKPNIGICLSNLKLVLGPELKIVYPFILNFAVSGELELNGLAHPKCIKPRGTLTFENGEVDLVAMQVRLKREHLNVARFEPDNGLDPMLDLTLVGSERQYRIHRRASNWQDFVEQDALSPIEVARRLDSQLAESILENNGQLAFEKLATATLEKLMPRIEGKGQFGLAKWKLVYAPQIPSLVSSGATVDPFTLLAANLSFGTDVEVQLGKRIQARIVRQMKESQMAMEWTLTYKLTSRLHLCLKNGSSKCVLFEYSASQD